MSVSVSYPSGYSTFQRFELLWHNNQLHAFIQDGHDLIIRMTLCAEDGIVQFGSHVRTIRGYSIAFFRMIEDAKLFSNGTIIEMFLQNLYGYESQLTAILDLADKLYTLQFNPPKTCFIRFANTIISIRNNDVIIQSTLGGRMAIFRDCRISFINSLLPCNSAISVAISDRNWRDLNTVLDNYDPRLALKMLPIPIRDAIIEQI